MLLIERYLLRQFAQSVAAVAVVLLLVGLGGLLVDLMSEIARGKVPAGLLLSQLGLRSIQVLPILLPLALFIGLLLAVGRLYGDSEMAVLSSVGRGPRQLLRPLLWVTLPAAAVVAFASLWAAPAGARLAQRMVEEANRSFLVAGLEAGRTTSGHRFLSGPIDIGSAEEYADAMCRGHVLVDADERAESIRRQIHEAAMTLDARAVVPEKTFAEVVNLVEFPTVGIGRFDERFLRVPREIVEEAMESHQRYFPLEATDGQLLDRFVVVHNGDPARTEAIIAGHERVIRARLADAAFFVEEDLSRPLEEYVHRLDTIVFHEKLGSLGAKVERIEEITRALAEAIDAPADEGAYAVRAAHLAKADLVTHAVIEFTSLQGVMGMRYAQAAGEAEGVAEAIVDHYRPRHAGDSLPRSLAGKLVSIADKLDTIVGIFAIGQGPTGSADPYALRRSAIGILTMMVDGGVRFDLDEAIAVALQGYAEALPGLDPNEVGAAVKTFFDGRLAVMLKDRGFTYDEVDAVMAVTSADPADTFRRITALAAFRRTEAGADLSVAFRRAANLADPDAGVVTDPMLMGAEEGALDHALVVASSSVGSLMAARDYDAALAALADLRTPVDAFFGAVMVMDSDEALRRNRLALLNRLGGLFDGFADFGKLAG